MYSKWLYPKSVKKPQLEAPTYFWEIKSLVANTNEVQLLFNSSAKAQSFVEEYSSAIKQSNAKQTIMAPFKSIIHIEGSSLVLGELSNLSFKVSETDC